MLNPNQPHNDKLDNLIKDFLQKNQNQPISVQLTLEEEQHLLDLLSNILTHQNNVEAKHRQLIESFNRDTDACQTQIENLKKNSKQLFDNYVSINSQIFDNYASINSQIAHNNQKVGSYLDQAEKLQGVSPQYSDYEIQIPRMDRILSYIHTGMLMLLLIISLYFLWKLPGAPEQNLAIQNTTTHAQETNPNPILVDYTFNNTDNVIAMLNEVNVDNVANKINSLEYQNLIETENFKNFKKVYCQQTHNEAKIICNNKNALNQLFILDYAKRFHDNNKNKKDKDE